MNEDITNIEQRLIDFYEGKLSADECAEVEAWIDSSNENRRMARRVFSLLLSADVQQVAKVIDTEKALKKTKAKRTVQKRFTDWRVWIQRAAVILFFPLVGFLLWQQDRLNSLLSEVCLQEVQTNPGMTTRLMLPDGTSVCLNSGSTLIFPSRFSGDTRSVRLVGEAYFEVAKDSKRRFVVETSNQTSVEVYGTHFNVEAYADGKDITTTLIEGKVGFLYNDGSVSKRVVLNPGQKLAYNVATRSLTSQYTNGVTELSWIEGKIIFANTPLPEALRILSKRFNVDFYVKDSRLNKNRFTGTFTTQRLEKILKYFEISTRIKWKYLNDPDINEEKIQIEIF